MSTGSLDLQHGPGAMMLGNMLAQVNNLYTQVHSEIKSKYETTDEASLDLNNNPNDEQTATEMNRPMQFSGIGIDESRSRPRPKSGSRRRPKSASPTKKLRPVMHAVAASAAFQRRPRSAGSTKRRSSKGCASVAYELQANNLFASESLPTHPTEMEQEIVDICAKRSGMDVTKFQKLYEKSMRFLLTMGSVVTLKVASPTQGEISNKTPLNVAIALAPQVVSFYFLDMLGLVEWLDALVALLGN